MYRKKEPLIRVLSEIYETMHKGGYFYENAINVLCDEIDATWSECC